MKEYTYSFIDGISKGLIATEKDIFNKQSFIQMDGAFVNDGIVVSTPDVNQLDLDSLGCSYPFPQVFYLKDLTIVGTATALYDYSAVGGLTSLITVDEGSTWSVADYHRFVVFTNGKAIIVRDGSSGEWREFTECTIPTGLCVCNLNGQLLIGGPETSCVAGFMG